MNYLKTYAFILVWLVAFTFIVPRIVKKRENDAVGSTGIGTETGTEITYAVITETAATGRYDFFDLSGEGVISVYNEETDETFEMLLEEHIFRVMLRYGLEDFDDEALKAFAVSVRTKALYENEKSKKATTDVFYKADSDIGPGYGDAVYVEKCYNAVISTKGVTVKYKGEYINAYYHLSSSGKTESHKNVYRTDIPYLTGVKTPDESFYKDFYGMRRFTKDQFKKAFADNGIDIAFTDDHRDWIEDISFDDCVRCKRMNICGTAVSGTTLMKVLGLKSTCVIVTTADDGFIFSTEGDGNGLGLSIYGACKMAKDGSDYVSILTHYYTSAAVS